MLLDLQNSPQFILAYYAILRADAVVIPVSPMNVTEELHHYLLDGGATTAIIAQDLYPRFKPLMGAAVTHAIVATYSDYLTEPTPLPIPAALAAARQEILDPGVVAGTMRSLPATIPSPRKARATTCAPSSTPRAPPAGPRAACTPTTA